MEVKISFDTEKESVDDLKRLVAALQDLISKREKFPSLGNTLAAPNISKPMMQKQEIRESQQVQAPAGDKTSGGGKLIPFQEMGDMMSKIYSGKM